jgi:hypothetical protein
MFILAMFILLWLTSWECALVVTCWFTGNIFNKLKELRR